MLEVLTKTISFIVTLGLLVTVHEFGHFIVARWLGVKVLRFSVGFGNPLWSRKAGPDATEYVIGTLPLGGYVKMLDEREGDVAAHELPHAFNRKPLSTRIAVVLAGPLFNLAFAVLVFGVMYVTGVPGIKPIVNRVNDATVAAQAGFAIGDEIMAVDGVSIRSWDQFINELITSSLVGKPVDVQVQRADLTTASLKLDLADALGWVEQGDFDVKLGLSAWPERIEPVVGALVADQPAIAAGLMRGDKIVGVNDVVIDDWKSWVNVIKSSPGKTLTVTYERNGEKQVTELTPAAHDLPDGQVIGRIGAGFQLYDDMQTVVDYPLTEATSRAFQSTWNLSISTLRMLGKIITGDASLRNISGPIKIAEVAGESVAQGFYAVLQVLAMLSVSLGVLNLLPIPVLDGGHLLYYVVEFFTRRPVSEAVQLVGQRIGIAIIVALMGIAFFNDITGLLGVAG